MSLVVKVITLPVALLTRRKRRRTAPSPNWVLKFYSKTEIRKVYIAVSTLHYVFILLIIRANFGTTPNVSYLITSLARSRVPLNWVHFHTETVYYRFKSKALQDQIWCKVKPCWVNNVNKFEPIWLATNQKQLFRTHKTFCRTSAVT